MLAYLEKVFSAMKSQSLIADPAVLPSGTKPELAAGSAVDPPRGRQENLLARAGFTEAEIADLFFE
jgi:hypothetical protein